MVDRPRCLDWTPLATQQLRLRNLIQIIGFNVECDSNASDLYFTLHSSPLAAPFYKSQAIEKPSVSSRALIWPEINCEQMARSAAHCVCIRVWQQPTRADSTEPDKALFVWGVYFSGLVPVVRKADARYRTNTLIFQMHGGQFASADSFVDTSKVAFPVGLPNFGRTPPPADSSCDEMTRLKHSLRQLSAASVTGESTTKHLLAIKSSPDLSSFLWNGGAALKSPSSVPNAMEQWEARSTDTRLLKFRYLQMQFKDSDCRRSYSVSKLLQLHEKQRRIKYQMEENEELRDKICTKSAYCLNLEMVTNRTLYIRPQQVGVFHFFFLSLF